MNYTAKWISIVEYYDEDGTEIKIKTNTEFKKYKKINYEKFISHEHKKVYHRYVLQRNKSEQLELFK
jgi:hypothetical protein